MKTHTLTWKMRMRPLSIGFDAEKRKMMMRILDGTSSDEKHAVVRVAQVEYELGDQIQNGDDHSIPKLWIYWFALVLENLR